MHVIQSYSVSKRTCAVRPEHSQFHMSKGGCDETSVDLFGDAWHLEVVETELREARHAVQ